MEIRRFMQPAYGGQVHGEGRGLSVTSKSQKSSWDAVLGRGLAGWLLRWWRNRAAPASRLMLLDRIAIGPRQALVLVEADGVRVLIATSPEGASTFLPLHPAVTQALSLPQDQPSSLKATVDRDLGPMNKPGKSEVRTSSRAGSQSRVSW